MISSKISPQSSSFIADEATSAFITRKEKLNIEIDNERDNIQKNLDSTNS